MILPILGIAFILIATYFAYKNATEYGRNPIVWALVTFFVGFGLQWVFPIILMIGLTVFWMATGSSQREVIETLDGYSIIITLGTLFASVAALGLILKHVSKMPEEKSYVQPPTPPSF